MRAVVTGGAGFIGSHLVDALVAAGDSVTVVDNLTRGRVGRLPTSADLRQASVTDTTSLHAIIAEAEPDLIFHLAAQIDVRESVTDPVADAETNVVGSINVLTAAQAAGARIVFAGTGGALYGEHAPVPAGEDVPPEPESPYGAAKWCAENYIAMFNRLYGARHCVLRMANVYGPRQDSTGDAGVVSIFANQIAQGQPPTVFGDGTATRDFVYVGDVVEAFMIAARAGEAGMWNIATGVEASVGKLVELLGKASGREVVPRFAPARLGELQRSCLAADKAARDLGWSARTPLAQGVEMVYRWIEAGAPDRGPA